MAWAKAHVEIKPASVGTGVKAILRQSKKSPAALSFTFTEAVGKKLSWSDGDGVEVLIGEGEHHGLVRIRKNNSAAVTKIQRRETGKGAWFSLKLGHQPTFIDRSEAPAWCQWEAVEDGWLEIVLPKWADETAPSKAKAAAPASPHPTSAKPARRGIDVTAQLMGDPPPGRREMLENFDKTAGR